MTPRVYLRNCRLLIAALGVTLLAASSSPAQAQLTAQQLAGLKPRVTGILRQTSAPSAEDLKIIDEYFTKSFFPAISSDDPIQRGQLAKNRKDLFAQFINIKGSPEARNHLLNLTRVNVGKLAVGNYHPAIRYNAVLIISQLDKELPATAAAAPVPLPEGTAALIALVDSADFRGVAVPSSVKVAALIGLDRHTRFGVDPKFAEAITKSALAVATRTETPEDISPEVNDWMRRLAVRVLANQFAKGLTAPVNDAVVKLIGDKNMNLDDRCGVAELLKKEMYPAGQGVDPAAMAVALGTLAKDVLTFEAKEAAAYNKAILADGGASFTAGPAMRGPEMFGGFEGGGYGGSPLAEDGTKFKKRRMLERLRALGDSAGALANAGGSDEVKQRMTDLAAPINETFDLGVKADVPDVEVSKAVISASKEVNSLVAKWVPADEPAEGEEEEPFADAAEAAAAPAGEAPAAAAAAEGAAAEPAAAEGARAVEAPGAEAPAAEEPAN